MALNKQKALTQPQFFAVGAGVKIPQVGADERTYDVPKKQTPDTVLVTHPDLPVGVSDDYVKKISCDITFADDVVKDRSFHTMPYDEKYFKEALDISDIVSPRQKANILVGRHNQRGSDQKHMPCHLKKTAKHKLKPLKRQIMDKAIKLHQEAALRKSHKETHEELSKDTLPKSAPAKSAANKTAPSDSTNVFLTQSNVDAFNKANHDVSTPVTNKSKRQHDWSEYLMSILSEQTARWIVNTRMSDNEFNKETLDKMLALRYGKSSETELIRDNISEDEGEIEFRLVGKKDQAQPSDTKKWKKKGDNMVEKMRKQERPNTTVPYSDKTNAAFYRLPAGIRREKKYIDAEEKGAINQTAHRVHVKAYVPPSPPTLRDYMNPAVGDKAYNTENAYQQEWLTGGEQIYQQFGDRSKITMNSNNKYKKQLRNEFPGKPEAWFPETSDEKHKRLNHTTKVKRAEKGLHRWKSLPEPIDDTAETLNLMPPGYDSEYNRDPDPTERRKVRNNTSLSKIVEDWQSKWHLNSRYADSKANDLIHDMADIHPHIRLKAIATCSRAADYRPPRELGIELNPSQRQISQISLLPEEIFLCLECLLEDEVEQVKRAAAICLYTLEKPTPEAEEILRVALREDTSVDRWAAAQCLAYYGVCDSEVVGELVAQIMNSEDAIRHEQAAHLLAKLSNNSTLVHSMISEQLNSSSWRHKIIACKLLPKLHGQINKDLAQKLANLMWNDWHSEVRKVAAQTLGKCGHGKDVHDDLKERIISGNERERMDAVSKIGHLGLMTAKLLPTFLTCFNDQYVSVRIETCITCGNLRIVDEKIQNKLIFLATYDNIWKVKALALQALGKINVKSEEVRKCILWALRYEEEAGVRAEACHSLVKIGFHDREVIEILQNRFLVETSAVVKREIEFALEALGISPTQDMDMVAQVKSEVRKLCTRDNICAHIIEHEENVEQKENIQRMIAKKKPEPKVEITEKPRTASRAPTATRRLMSPIMSEGTFTPTADRELTALLTREATEMSQSDYQSQTMSRPQTGVSSYSYITEEMASETETTHTGVRSRMSHTSEGPSGFNFDSKEMVVEITPDPRDTSTSQTYRVDYRPPTRERPTNLDPDTLQRYEDALFEEGVNLAQSRDPTTVNEPPSKQNTTNNNNRSTHNDNLSVYSDSTQDSTSNGINDHKDTQTINNAKTNEDNADNTNEINPDTVDKSDANEIPLTDAITTDQLEIVDKIEVCSVTTDDLSTENTIDQNNDEQKSESGE
ncbi:unnamed protein product [Owenia fusiformis]|uniref:Uncharacterized protein n=1 Tax=Owenia fusiformis TaxID=6347 RepID=A0A8J1T4W9_OWEFU|nr:unnamed protein product [Owenia fusiformis]